MTWSRKFNRQLGGGHLLPDFKELESNIKQEEFEGGGKDYSDVTGAVELPDEIRRKKKNSRFQGRNNPDNRPASQTLNRPTGNRPEGNRPPQDPRPGGNRPEGNRPPQGSRQEGNRPENRPPQGNRPPMDRGGFRPDNRPNENRKDDKNEKGDV